MTVMERHNLTITILVFSIVAVMGIGGLSLRRDNPAQATVVSMAQTGATKRITVEFRRTNPAACFSEELQVQTRQGGRWQPPQKFPSLGETRLLAGTNSHRVIFTLPARTDACRFLLAFRVGGSPYCQAHWFLTRRGWRQKFPNLSRALLRWVPRQPRLRLIELELPIPAAPSTAQPVVAGARTPFSGCVRNHALHAHDRSGVCDHPNRNARNSLCPVFPG